jgi:CRISPR-associated protein Cmr1
MQTIEASFEIVTPMFIGGGTPEEVDLRPPSIKGALRFWWRALQWGQCLQESEHNPSAALKLLHQREAELFGAAVKDEKYGQGKLQIKLKSNHLRETQLANLSSGQTYLLGQGLFNKVILKKALGENQTFTLCIKLANDVESESVINTLLIWGLLGGLGSRARKGWGSVAIRSLIYKKNLGAEGVTIEIQNSIDAYKMKLQQLLQNAASSLPPFTAFSNETRIDLSKTGNNALTLLGEIGLEMQKYRSFGQSKNGEHKVGNEKAEQNFKNDHNVVLEFAKGTETTEHPRRVIFGLPHNYFFANQSKVDVIAVDTQIPKVKKKERQRRRSSPLFIHIHKLGNEYIAVQSLIEADFLPDTYKIQLENTTRNYQGNPVELDCDIDWKDITHYLDRFNKGTGRFV